MLLRLAVAGLFAASAAYSTELTIENVRAQELVSAARFLEKRQASFTLPQIDTLVSSDGMQLAMQTCRSDILRPALTVQLVSASVHDVSADFDAWSRSITQAQALVHHMGRCMPSEGNVWVRESMLSRAIAENPTDLADKIGISAALSPNEMVQLYARLAIWRKVTPATLKAAHDVLASDIATILNYGDRQILETLLGQRPPALEAVMDSELAKLSDVRRAHIEDVRGRLGKVRRLH